MTTQTASVKRGRGRPLKDVKGALIWTPAEYVDLATAYLEFLKQQTALNNEKWGKVKQ